MKTVWVLTRSINAHEQDGEYFVAVFKNFPLYDQFCKTVGNDPESPYSQREYDNLVANNGGRISNEYEWYDITEIEL